MWICPISTHFWVIIPGLSRSALVCPGLSSMSITMSATLLPTSLATLSTSKALNPTQWTQQSVSYSPRWVYRAARAAKKDVWQYCYPSHFQVCPSPLNVVLSLTFSQTIILLLILLSFPPQWGRISKSVTAAASFSLTRLLALHLPRAPSRNKLKEKQENRKENQVICSASAVGKKYSKPDFDPSPMLQKRFKCKLGQNNWFQQWWIFLYKNIQDYKGIFRKI